MKILVTGCAGFIGMHLCERLLAAGTDVIGVDNMNDYYDVMLKRARLERLSQQPKFRFSQMDIADRSAMADLFRQERPSKVVNLAAQAGVRYSLRNPSVYVDSNLVGFSNVLEGCRDVGCQHLVFASSSSVYGGNTHIPFSEHDNVDHPVSLYAATKKANELMAHTYSHLFGLPATGLRFFTVYGPWGRPDMALFLFTKAMLAGKPIDIFNEGRMVRDFTYIDDIVEGLVRVLDMPPTENPAFDRACPDPATSWAPWRIANIGNNRPVDLMAYIDVLEQALGVTAEKNLMPMQAGDVQATYADITTLQELVGFSPRMQIEEGVHRFVDWYRSYYHQS